jgi:hypothetical protein
MKNSDIFKWIQSIVPDGKTCYKDIRKSEPDGYIKFSQEVIPYDFRLVFEQFMHEGHDKTGKYLSYCARIGDSHQQIWFYPTGTSGSLALCHPAGAGTGGADRFRGSDGVLPAHGCFGATLRGGPILKTQNLSL